MDKKNIKTCETHMHEELVVYCKTCRKVICVKCSREEHLRHVCEGVSKTAREIRQSFSKQCTEIRDKTVANLKMDLSLTKTSLLLNTEEYETEIRNLDILEKQIIDKVRQSLLIKSADCFTMITSVNLNLSLTNEQRQEIIHFLQEKIQSLRDSRYIKNAYRILALKKEVTSLGDSAKDYKRLMPKTYTYRSLDKEATLDEVKKSLTRVHHNTNDANDGELENEIEIFSSVQCDVNESLLDSSATDFVLPSLCEVGLITIERSRSASVKVKGTFRGICKAYLFICKIY